MKTFNEYVYCYFKLAVFIVREILFFLLTLDVFFNMGIYTPSILFVKRYLRKWFRPNLSYMARASRKILTGNAPERVG